MVAVEPSTLHAPKTQVTVNTPYLKLKAGFDVLFALLLLIVLAPLLVLIALLIRLDSAGPALYRQTRVGRHGRSFIIFKFRTMLADAPVLSTAEMQQQVRIPFTRLGPLLRKTSLDELPQLLNILRGEMSFIGPRPALPSQEDVNALRERHGVHALRPGITGLAQVMGRDELDADTKVAFDTAYLERISLRHDCYILARTIAAVSSARGNK